MKKNLLFVTLLFVSAVVFGQNKVRTTSAYQIPDFAKRITAVADMNAATAGEFVPFQTLNPTVCTQAKPVNLVEHTMGVITESVIGNTVYDAQTNAAVSNRLLYNSDGTVSAVWTSAWDLGTAAPPYSWPSRGTGYNYYNSGWGTAPAARIESVRVGFTNIAVTDNNMECVMAHTGAVGPLFNSRTKGSGAWTANAATNVPNSLWSKMIAGGANGQTLHALVLGDTGGVNAQYRPLMYNRSLDAGATWSGWAVPAEINNTHYVGFSSDCYSIDAKGDEVAFVAGSLWTDLIIMKSMDNGANWTKIIVDSFPIPLYNPDGMISDLDNDGLVDTTEQHSGDTHIMIDNNGMCHLFYSKTRVYDGTAAGTTYNYYPFGTAELYYWNETFGPDSEVILPSYLDANGNGIIDLPDGGCGKYSNGGLTQCPSSGVDAANNLYVAYQTFAEEPLADTSITGEGHKHVFVMKSLDNGLTWSIPLDILPTAAVGGDGYLQEGVYACLAKRVDNDLHLTYQRDYYQGVATDADATIASNNASLASEIVYAQIPTADLILGVNDQPGNTDFYVSQNSPNPSAGATVISFTVNKKLDVNFKITDLLGKVVYEENHGSLNQGSYNIEVNTSKMSSGVYCYTVKVGDAAVTKKMIVE